MNSLISGYTVICSFFQNACAKTCETDLQYSSPAHRHETGNIHSPFSSGSDRTVNANISFPVSYDPSFTHSTYAIAGCIWMNVHKRQTDTENFAISKISDRNASLAITQKITAGAFNNKHSINDTF